jgi:hypothetical protein
VAVLTRHTQAQAPPKYGLGAYYVPDRIGVELNMNTRQVRFNKNGGNPGYWVALTGTGSYSFTANLSNNGDRWEMLPDSCWHTS